MAVLGLVVVKPDTLTGIRNRLTELFPHAGWSSSVAYTNLTGLTKQGLVSLTVQGEARGEDGYESTPKGVARFRWWLREGSEAAPALHDPTRARLLLCEDDDLPVMVEMLRAEQKVCADRFDRARWFVSRAKRRGRPRPEDGSPDRGRLLFALMVDDMTLWGNRAIRLKRLRWTLEGRDEDELDLDIRDFEDDKKDG